MPSIIGAVAVRTDSYSDPSVLVHLADINCTGDESVLLDCSYNIADSNICLSLKDAEVVCQGIATYTVSFCCSVTGKLYC